MRRRDLIRHLTRHGCELLREGSRHSLFVNRERQGMSAVPRHNEINDLLARRICQDLKIPEPRER